MTQANPSGEPPVSPQPTLQMLVAEVAEALQALHTVSTLAIPDSAARQEAQYQTQRLAQNLMLLIPRAGNDIQLEYLQVAWDSLRARLELFLPPAAPFAPTPPPEIRPMPEPVNAPNLNETTGIQHVVLASLETDGNTALYLNRAAQTFPRQSWQVTNLGAHVPIMALTGAVVELRPVLLALIFDKGQLIPETIRLIADLKARLPGLRVIALGPALAQANMAERLRADLYSSDPTKAAELAQQFFEPLARLGNRLRLNLEDIPLVRTDEKVAERKAEG